MISRLLAALDECKVEWEALPHWLSLILIAERTPKVLAPHLERIRRHLDNNSLLWRLLASHVGALVSGVDEPPIRPTTMATSNPTVPQWFKDILETDPLKFRFRRIPGQASEELIGLTYLKAVQIGLTQDNSRELQKADDYCRDQDGWMRVHDTRLHAILMSSFVHAVSVAQLDDEHGEGWRNYESIKALSFDLIGALIKPTPTPDWISLPLIAYDDHSRRSEPAQLSPFVDWSEVTGIDNSGWTVLSTQACIHDGRTSENSSIVPFLFASDMENPTVDDNDAKYLFDCIRTLITMPRSSIPRASTPYKNCFPPSPQFPIPISLTSLEAYPITCSYRPHGERWHDLPGYYPTSVVMPNTPISRSLTCQSEPGRPMYMNGDQVVIRGQYWQEPHPRNHHYILGLRGGFVLLARTGWLTQLLASLDHRLGFVRHTVLRERHEYRVEARQEHSRTTCHLDISLPF